MLTPSCRRSDDEITVKHVPDMQQMLSGAADAKGAATAATADAQGDEGGVKIKADASSSGGNTTIATTSASSAA